MNRRNKREQLFKLLFRVEFNDLSEMDDQTRLYFENLDSQVTDEDKEELTDKLGKVISLLPEIDGKVEEKVTGWSIDRIGKAELTIIRLAVYEMFYDDEVPVSVAINEAVELSKKYGQDESGSFVNGVLGKIAK